MFEQALRFDPGDPVCRYHWGHLELYDGRWKEAIRQFQLVLQSTSKHLEPYHYIRALCSSAIAYNQLGDPETALAILDQLEGYRGPGQPNHYERITVTAIDADGEKYTCYTYVYPSERKEWLEQHAEQVFGVDWMVFLHSKDEVMYFAYGSCMSERDFRRTVPHFEVMGRAVLDDHRLAFTRYSRGRQGGVADIVPSPGDRVEGVLYKIPARYVTELDWREGVPAGVYRREYVDVQCKGQLVSALTYVVVEKQLDEIAPSESYASIILDEGASLLSTHYTERVRRHIEHLRRRER